MRHAWDYAEFGAVSAAGGSGGASFGSDVRLYGCGRQQRHRARPPCHRETCASAQRCVEREREKVRQWANWERRVMRRGSPACTVAAGAPVSRRRNGPSSKGCLLLDRARPRSLQAEVYVVCGWAGGGLCMSAAHGVSAQFRPQGEALNLSQRRIMSLAVLWSRNAQRNVTQRKERDAEKA